MSGVLAGEKQRENRGYDFSQIASHFGARADMILLLFDASKLDISDEMREVIESLRPHYPKLKVVLNKADACDQQTLMRVHSALMWSLSPVVRTPEVMRVYMGSFRDEPYDPAGHESFSLFDKERSDLMRDLNVLPRNNVLRKINALIKRARLCKVHATVLNFIKAQLDAVGKLNRKKKQEQKQEELFADISQVFAQAAQAHDLSMGDMPNPQKFCAAFASYDFSNFEPVDKR